VIGVRQSNGRRRLCGLLVALVTVVAAIMNLAALGDRMLLFTEVEGSVDVVQHRNRDARGTDVWYLRMQDRRGFFVDEPTASVIEGGDRIRSAAWSREIVVDDRSTAAPLRRVTWGPVLWTVICVGLVAWLLAAPARLGVRCCGPVRAGTRQRRSRQHR
jgi:hypothetical protein